MPSSNSLYWFSTARLRMLPLVVVPGRVPRPTVTTCLVEVMRSCYRARRVAVSPSALWDTGFLVLADQYFSGYTPEHRGADAGAYFSPLWNGAVRRFNVNCRC